MVRFTTYFKRSTENTLKWLKPILPNIPKVKHHYFWILFYHLKTIPWKSVYLAKKFFFEKNMCLLCAHLIFSKNIFWHHKKFFGASYARAHPARDFPSCLKIANIRKKCKILVNFEKLFFQNFIFCALCTQIIHQIIFKHVLP